MFTSSGKGKMMKERKPAWLCARKKASSRGVTCSGSVTAMLRVPTA